MTKIYTYKGYSGSAEISQENLLWGKILYINDLVIYEGGSPDELETAFKNAVDEYLGTCLELGREPNKPFKGTFNVRVGAELHRDCVIAADRRKESLNEFVTKSLQQRLAKMGKESNQSQAASEQTMLDEVHSEFNPQVSKADTAVSHTSASVSVGEKRQPTLKVVK